MANAVAPFGFRPVRYLDGTPYNNATIPCLVDSGDATAMGVGDPVILSSAASGIAGQVVNGMDVEGIITVVTSTATTTGQTIYGVVTGFLPDPTSLQTRHRAASTSRIALVCPAKDVIFQVQEDGATTPVPSTAIGLNAAIVATTLNTTTGVSKQTLDSDSVNTTAALPLKVLGLSKIVGNAFNTAGAGSDTAIFDVVFNTGVLQDNIAGVA